MVNDWVTGNLVPFALATAALIGAMKVIWPKVKGGFWVVVHFAQRLHQFLEDWYGDEETPGVIHRLTAIEHQVHPNTGGSVADSVYRIEARVDDLQDKVILEDRRLDELYRLVQRLHGERAAHEDRG